MPADTGIVPRVSFDGAPALPLWRADTVSQRYLPGTNVLRTAARFGPGEGRGDGGGGGEVPRGPGQRGRGRQALRLGSMWRAPSAAPANDGGDSSACSAGRVGLSRPSRTRQRETSCGSVRAWCGPQRAAIAAGSRARGRSGAGAPRWARRMYGRSLLDAARPDRPPHAAPSPPAPATAGPTSGRATRQRRRSPSRGRATERRRRRVARFLSALDLGAAARFGGDGEPVPGRGEQGDAVGWVQLATVAGRTRESAPSSPPVADWRSRADYREGGGGEYLGNAIAAGANLRPFETGAGLVRRARDPASGLDSAAAWAVRPFSDLSAYPAVRRTLFQLLYHRHALRHHARRGLERWRRPLDRPDRVERLGTGGARRRRSEPGTGPRPGRPRRGPAPARRPAPRRNPGRRPARARRRPHRHPPLDHAARLVPRLRDPRPAPALALRSDAVEVCPAIRHKPLPRWVVRGSCSTPSARNDRHAFRRWRRGLRPPPPRRSRPASRRGRRPCGRGR